MTKQEYNGWYNHETWQFALWFNPDDFQDDMESISEDYVRKPGAFPSISDDDYKLQIFAVWLKDWFEDYLYERGCECSWSGIIGDLLNGAVSEINFDDISRSWMGSYLETLATEGA